MFGLLNIDKPAGLTSRDAVNVVQRLVRPHKVGHAGTLDPLATGVLIVAIGPATRLVEYVQRMPKTYQATFLLGRTSDTEDVEGAVVELSAPPIPNRAQLESALPQFMGTIQQEPPAYSALKIAGKRAHRMARRGETVTLAPRPVEIHAIEIVEYDYPQLELLVRCGSGTYVRSLGRDLARALGTDAVMSALRRLQIGSFRVADALALDSLTFPQLCDSLISPIKALADMPQVVLSGEEEQRIVRGQEIVNRFSVTSDEIAAIASNGQLTAILSRSGDHNLRPAKCFFQT
jgi:tRNA pseudouridine55 synthase